MPISFRCGSLAICCIMDAMTDHMMQAGFLTSIGRLEIMPSPMPRIAAEHDVLVKVDVLGVCGSDIHYYKTGRIGCQIVKFPWIVGHEFGGTVLEVGPAVKRLKVGDVVAVDPLVACGQCDQCRRGRIHTCRNQAFLGCPGQLPGALCQYIVMPQQCCYALPSGLDTRHGALIEPFSIGLHACNLAEAGKGSRVAILGSGPIGLCVLMALRKGPAISIAATDLLDYRLALAGRLGADLTLNAALPDATQQLLARQPLGYDYVFECAGKAEAIDQAVRLLAPGGCLVLIGIPPEDRISVDMNDLRRKELRLQCVRRQNECVKLAIEMLAAGKVNLNPLVTHEFSLAQSAAAFDLVSRYGDGVVKAMINIP